MAKYYESKYPDTFPGLPQDYEEESNEGEIFIAL